MTLKLVPHHGIDFGASRGEPVMATADGRVVATRWEGALGNTVRIQHGSKFVTVYGHLRGFARGLRPGTDVAQGQIIGHVGSTGRATGPHVHYTMLDSGRPVDPSRFRNPAAVALGLEWMPQLRAAMLRWEPVMETIDLDGGEMLAGGDPVDQKTGVL